MSMASGGCGYAPEKTCPVVLPSTKPSLKPNLAYLAYLASRDIPGVGMAGVDWWQPTGST
jgi:hypothetical protein